MNAVEALQPVIYGSRCPPAESSTSGVLQRRVAVLLRDEEQSSTALAGTSIVPDIASRPARRGYVCAHDLMLKFSENELTLVSRYTPNVAASIVTANDPQTFFVMPETCPIYFINDPREIFGMSETCPTNFIDATGFDFAAPVLVRKPKTIETLGSAYVISNVAKVESFIEENQLTEILVQAVEAIKRTFGESRTRTLTVLEDDEGSRTLFCLVAFPGSLDDARKALESFDRNWWLKNARRFGSKLNFDFELV